MKRYELTRFESCGGLDAGMEPHPEGEWVRYEDVAAVINEAIQYLDGEPEYHNQGMGCGLEDRGITDRYDAMAYGWEQAMERVYGENIAWAKDTLLSSAKGGS